MFIGHFAVGFAAKRAAPQLSLAALFAAAQLADLLWPFLLPFGGEQVQIEPGPNPLLVLNFVSYPYSHSLAMLIVWGVLFGWICRRVAGGRRVLGIVAALVVSHWFLDSVTHRPDMPLYPGGPKVGLGLWNSVPATVAVEVPLFIVGVWLYAASTRARDAIGRWAFWSFVAFLLVAYIGNLVGEPPPSVAVLSLSVIIGSAILLVWSWWTDRHRVVISEAGRSAAP